MKFSQIALLVCLLYASAGAQAQPTPTYYNVLKNFISNYDPQLNRYSNFSFAKKPGGWFVQVLESEDLAADPSREYSKQYLYWSKTKGVYLPLSEFEQKTADETQIAKFWSSAMNFWYDMNRNLYFGYNGWDVDVIRELEGKADINDTLRESLARAYGNYAHRYLWYQSGGTPGTNDPLQRKRAPLEKVPEAAADSAAAYILKSADQYRIIAAHNPWYPTMVGSAALKLNNELLFGWQMMVLSGYPQKAEPFFRAVQLDSAQVRIAKKLLDECPHNSILITYGDNDTYQLCYVQEAMGYRKDVNVVNISMLGVPEYANWLKKENKVAFSLTKETFGRKGFYYVLIGASDKREDPQTQLVKSVSQLIAEISSLPQAVEMSSKVFMADSLIIPVSANTNLWKSSKVKPAASISPALRSYYLLSDLMLMDIVNDNISRRPIYFTSQEDALFQPYQLDRGMVYELIPANLLSANKALSVAAMEAVTAHESDFLPIYRGADNQARGNLDRLINNRLVLAGYYKENNDVRKKKHHLTAAASLLQQNRESVWKSSGFYVGNCFIEFNQDLKQGQALIEDYLRQFVAESRDYNNALVPPESDHGEHYYKNAREVFEKHKLDTKGIDAIWKQRIAR